GFSPKSISPTVDCTEAGEKKMIPNDTGSTKTEVKKRSWSDVVSGKMPIST
ncbi:unnamed protein product, partial [Linum tenue]